MEGYDSIDSGGRGRQHDRSDRVIEQVGNAKRGEEGGRFREAGHIFCMGRAHVVYVQRARCA